MTIAENRIIHGKTFLKALRDAGVISEEDKIRRVVIDASVSAACVMYVERFADERVLKVAMTLDGIEIRES